MIFSYKHACVCVHVCVYGRVGRKELSFFMYLVYRTICTLPGVQVSKEHLIKGPHPRGFSTCLLLQTVFQGKLSTWGWGAWHLGRPTHNPPRVSPTPKQSTPWSAGIQALVPDVPLTCVALTQVVVAQPSRPQHVNPCPYNTQKLNTLHRNTEAGPPQSKTHLSLLSVAPVSLRLALTWKMTPLREGHVGTRIQPHLLPWNPRSLRDLPSVLRAHFHSGWGVISLPLCQ